MAPKRETRASQQASEASAVAASSSATGDLAFASSPAEAPAPASEAAAAAAAIVEPALTHVQQALQRILKVDSSRSPAETYMALAALESRELPKQIATKELEPRFNPRMCCFDQASSPPSWSAWVVCERCKLLNELIQVCSRSAPSSAHKSLIGTSLFITACTSEQLQKGETPTLPTELISMVVEFAIAQARHKDDGLPLTNLLHTSQAIRRQIAKVFKSIILYECTETLGTSSLLIARSLNSFVHDVARSLLVDFTCKDRFAKKSKFKVPITSCTGETFGLIMWTVTINADAFSPRPAKRVKKEQLKLSSQTYSMANVSVVDVCRKLEETISRKGLLEPPRVANVFQQARSNHPFDGPKSRIEVLITLSLTDIDDTELESVESRTWRFINK